MREQQLQTVEAVNRFLNENLTGKPIEVLIEKWGPKSPSREDQAQELAYQAMEADDSTHAVRLAKKALKLDPNNLDATCVVVFTEAASAESAVKRLRPAIRQWEEKFDEEFMQRTRGHFWGEVRTRPYMRARKALFDLLVQLQRVDEAIAEAESMLELNPNDNQGIRDYLLGLYLQCDRTTDARALMKRYREPDFAVQAWGGVLERFLSNKKREARSALSRAFKQNPYVLPYLTGLYELPEHPPVSYGLGDENEAYHCIATIGIAWLVHEDAMIWLVESARDVLREWSDA